MSKEEMIKYVGNKVKEMRKASKLNQVQIADYLGISRVNLTNIENGNNGTSFVSIYKLCCLFGCQLSDIFPPIVKVAISYEEIEVTRFVATKVKIQKPTIK
jgi:DNA-binding XRE family transcriptional regulator